MNPLPDFATFFQELWGYEPFPWQDMLANRVVNGSWPEALDLPTAAGKTACIDVAIYALACQADRDVTERTAPRRIWFVVDRRIVVDEAYDRAIVIARKLAEATDGPLKDVADCLRRVSGTKRPLATARLRGGILHDDGWASLPCQPAVITSTVDQVGSRVLFRGYGRSHLAAPIFAGLVANDSLVILDEAHCSVPFLQTLRSISTYRGEAWAESQLRTPFAFVILSATLPEGISDKSIFPGTARDQALDHPILRARLGASKPAELVEAKAVREGSDDPFVRDAAKRATAYVRKGNRKRVAVIVNRVRTAEEIACAIREDVEDDADVVLLTGRMRPYERDQLVMRWKPFLRASAPDDHEKPILLVSTQCIEVGADFSFDALVTQAASLDALRQRFGRLNRMGLPGATPATILMRKEDSSSGEPDPVYGPALAAVWNLLNEKATEVQNGNERGKSIDFGFDSLKIILDGVGDLSPYLAPKPDAPILLPAHIDLLSQTAPRPYAEPDVRIFLHGKQRGIPEARVVWRTDLSEDDSGTWSDTIALCPPIGGEMLSVPLYRLRAWLADSNTTNDVSDVESSVAPGDDSIESTRAFLLYQANGNSSVCRDTTDLIPNDVVVIPACYGMVGLGQSAPAKTMGEHAIDLWELARIAAGRSPALRVHPSVLQPWLSCPPLRELVTLAGNPDWERDALMDGIKAVLDYRQITDDSPAAPPSWLCDLIGEVRNGRIENHPTGCGVVLFAHQNAKGKARDKGEMFADDDDLISSGDCEVSLAAHMASVERAVGKLAARCLPRQLREPIQLAARWHDAGKIDERFQTLLRHGDEPAAVAGEPLAKSASMPALPSRRMSIRLATGLPLGFRHEMLSAQLAERCAILPELEEATLVLHLIASHHGHARPFAPISHDAEPPGIYGRHYGVDINLDADTRRSLVPPHRLDSGVAESFWRLTRRYGWWGLAYMEAILRLGDWYGSEFVMTENEDAEGTP